MFRQNRGAIRAASTGYDRPAAPSLRQNPKNAQGRLSATLSA